jgi:hypothetical protein
VFEADRHFPDLDKLPGEFGASAMSEEMEENGARYQFFEYTRLN